MSLPVPVEAARRLSESLKRLGHVAGDNPVVDDELALIEFVEQFGPNELPDMRVAGTIGEISLDCPNTVEASIDVIRLNGRAFVPEELVIDLEEIPTAKLEQALNVLDDLSSEDKERLAVLIERGIIKE